MNNSVLSVPFAPCYSSQESRTDWAMRTGTKMSPCLDSLELKRNLTRVHTTVFKYRETYQETPNLVNA